MFFIIETVFLVGVAGVSFLAGFGLTLGKAKKSATDDWNQSNASSTTTSGQKVKVSDPQIELARKQVKLHQEATKLGLRALGWGTFYAVSGVTIFSLLVWKMLGVNNLNEFRNKVGSFLPRLTNEQANNNSRTQFDSLTDLIQYIIDEDNKNKSKSNVTSEK